MWAFGDDAWCEEHYYYPVYSRILQEDNPRIDELCSRADQTGPDVVQRLGRKS